MPLNHKDISRIAMLIFKYSEKSLNATEELELNHWLSADLNIKEVFDQLKTPEFVREELEIMNRFDPEESLRHFHEKHIQRKTTRLFPRNFMRVAVAAAVLIAIGIGLFYSNDYPSTAPQRLGLNDIGPAKNSATLTLANGRRIRLSDARNGDLAMGAGVKITKTKAGQIIYTVNDQVKPEAVKASMDYNTLATAYGETFQVLLPDGSKVWLNAGSSLKYPTSFTGIQQRKVELSGEAYFEISKDKLHPFIVVSPGLEVEVLGTHFNINAYQNEPSIKTTLLLGSVKINKNTLLKPNQQAIVSPDGIKVIPVIADAFVDWKDGVFNFEDEKLHSIMRKLSRWYNVRVVYEEVEEDKQTYSGYLSRSSNVSQVLQRLTDISNLKFKLSGETIVVSK